MIWKRNLEEVARTLQTLPPAPWSVKTGQNNERMLVDANQNPIMILASFPFPAEVKDENDPAISEYCKQFTLLRILCAMRNNCDTWFEEMVKANINDITLPKKPKQEPPAFKYVAPEPQVFYLKDLLP